MSLLASTPEEFAQTLSRRRAWLIRDPDTGRLEASETALDGMAREIAADERDFAEHEALFFAVGEDTGSLMTAFLHNTVRGQGAGGVRYWRYDSMRALVSDGLRLSQGMGRKNALAGLWWGGGKGVVAKDDGELWRDPAHRSAVYREYGRFITSLRGAYVTAEDAGTNAADMAEIFRETRFTTCVPTSVGGSGNPSFATARGVVSAMEGALDFLDLGSLAEKRVAMQGTGNVGAAMIGDLLDRGASVVATELSRERADELRSLHAGKPVEIRLVEPHDASIFSEECDIFAPNALGGVLGPDTIPALRTKVVCGAANNQLLDDRRDDEMLERRGIVYVPDFLANRMGIVNCANEQYGTLQNDPDITRHLGRDWDRSVYRTTRRVLERAKTDGVTPARAANALADELGAEPHPIWGHRTRKIIDGIRAGDWG